MHRYRLLHRCFLRVPLLAVHLRLKPNGFLRESCPLVHTAGLLLSLLLVMIQPESMPFPVQLYVLALWHGCLCCFGVKELLLIPGDYPAKGSSKVALTRSSTVQSMVSICVLADAW